MHEMEKAKSKRGWYKRYGTRGVRRIAKGLNTQIDADDVGQTLKDASDSMSAMPVLWDLRRPYRLLLAMTGICIAMLTGILGWVLLWPKHFSGVSLYAALAVVGITTTVAIWAGLRARSIRAEEMRLPSILDGSQIEEAITFVRTFGPITAFDTAGMLLLALAGGLDGALCGWVVSSGLADSVPLIAVFLASSIFAVVFIAALRWIVSKFVSCCNSIRAKRWVAGLSKMDFGRYPQKKRELEYVTEKLGHLTGDDFDEPTYRDYLGAAGLLLLIPALFGLLLAFRIFIANRDGAADLEVVLGLSALCAVIGTLAAGLAAMSHLLPQEAATKTKLAKRFPSVMAFQSWTETYTRETQRWANDAARRINNVLRVLERKQDYRRQRAGISIPRPFPPEVAVGNPAKTPDATGATKMVPPDQAPANDSDPTHQSREAA